MRNLITEGLQIKTEIDALNARLKEVQAKISAAASFPEGKGTTYIDGQGARAKIVRRTVESWDQEKLNGARATLGDEMFFTVFGFEFKPRGKKAVEGFLSFAPEEKKRPILDALTVKQALSVSFEAMEV